MPEHPMAVPIAPTLKALPWVSVTITANSLLNSASKNFLISKADLSGFSGTGVARPSSTLDSSIAAFAQTNPCLVSQIIKLGPTSTISFDCWIIASTNLGSFLDCSATSTAFADGSIPSNLIIFPSAFEINVSAIKIISPSHKS